MKTGFYLSNLTIIFALFAMLAVLGSPSRTEAISPSSILVDVVPVNPTPGENVTITLNSYATSLDSVLITWSVNGKTVGSSIGQKSISVTAGAAGVTTNVTALIHLSDGDISTKMVIRPQVLTLLYEANDSYVPPFYRGKALPSEGSEIKIVAMPEAKNSAGAMLDPKTLTYAWTKDYSNDQGGSGYGKNFFLYTNDYLEGTSAIGVTASTTTQSYSSVANITVPGVEPKILFYKNDNTMGTIWNNTLSSPHAINGDEVVVAIPYFISPKQIQNPMLVWNWSINGSPVSVINFKKNFMPLAVPTGSSGTSKLQLEITNTNKIFQTASRELDIQF